MSGVSIWVADTELNISAYTNKEIQVKLTKTFAAGLITLSLSAGSAYSNENCDFDLLHIEVSKLILQIDAKTEEGWATAKAAVNEAETQGFSGTTDEIECSKLDFVIGSLEQTLSQLP